MIEYSLLFPGQGSQYVGMGKSFFENPKGSQLIEEASDLLKLPLRQMLLLGPLALLTDTSIAQPAILLHSYAAFQALSERTPFRISSILGHSLGEYTGLVAASVLSFADALKAVHIRGKYMQEAVPKGQGAMAAVLGLCAESISDVLLNFADAKSDNYVACANFNGPSQTVIAGTTAGVIKASEELKLKGAKRVIELPVSAPFHCALMKPAQEKMAHVLDSITFNDSLVPVISNVSAQPEKNGQRIKQISSPVRFTECVKSMRQNNLTGSLTIELGPKNTLCGIVKKIDEDAKVMNIDSIDDLNKINEMRLG
jgi:[acyl-carrier-protein] S-malonyltransferase